MLVTLFTSLGTPMIIAGDEFARTQRGNNNAYCQDDAISWLDWAQAASPEGRSLAAFTSRLTALRRAYPMLRSNRFLHGDLSPGAGLDDVEWWDERGEHLSAEDWQNPEGRALVMRRSSRLEDGRVEVLTLLLNAAPDALTFRFPEAEADRRVLIDSADPAIDDLRVGDSYEVAAQGAALLRWTLETAS